jgi:hypothetical protein
MKGIKEVLEDWDDLDNDLKLEFRENLEEYFRIASKWYAEDLDLFDEYYNLTNDPVLKSRVKELGYPIDWNMDLHMSSENYENFKECLGEIQCQLGYEDDGLFLTIMSWSIDKNLLLAETLEELGL